MNNFIARKSFIGKWKAILNLGDDMDKLITLEEYLDPFDENEQIHVYTILGKGIPKKRFTALEWSVIVESAIDTHNNFGKDGVVWDRNGYLQKEYV